MQLVQERMILGCLHDDKQKPWIGLKSCTKDDSAVERIGCQWRARILGVWLKVLKIGRLVASGEPDSQRWRLQGPTRLPGFSVGG
jgi:hypothetical protein